MYYLVSELFNPFLYICILIYVNKNIFIFITFKKIVKSSFTISSAGKIVSFLSEGSTRIKSVSFLRSTNLQKIYVCCNFIGARLIVFDIWAFP